MSKQPNHTPQITSEEATLLEESLKEPIETDQDTQEKKKRTMLLGVGALVAVLIVGGSAWGINAYNKSKEITLPLEPVEEADTTQQVVETTERGIEIESSAEGWDEQTSTPMIVHVSGTTQSGTLVESWSIAQANNTQSFEFNTGSYEISFISPINVDGSIYAVPESTSVDLKGESVTVAAPLELISVENATKEQVDAVVAQIQDAVTKAQEADPAGSVATLGEQLITKAVENAAQNPQEQASGATTESIDTSSKEAASNGTIETPKTTVTTNTNINTQPSQNQPSTPTNNESPAPNQKEKVWVVDYEDVWVPNVVTITDEQAWDEPVYSTSKVFITTDGKEFTDEDALDQYMYKKLKNEGISINYTQTEKKTQTGTKHHPAETHTEDHGYWTKVESGGHWE